MEPSSSIATPLQPTPVPALVDYQQVHLRLPQKALAVLPLGVLAFAAVTIVAAYKATFAAGVLDYQHRPVTCPPISMLMFAGPGRRMGQIGFPSVSVLFNAVGWPFYGLLTRVIASTNKNHPILLFGLKATSTIGFIGLAIVGLIPLQEDLELLMKRQVELRWDSIVHQTAALVFFLSSILHMGLWLWLATTCHPSLPIHRKQSPKSFRLKVACFILVFFPLPTAFLLHPISPLRKKLELNRNDAGGITQYALVACVSTFFASYSSELWSVQQYAERLNQLQMQVPKSAAAAEVKKEK